MCSETDALAALEAAVSHVAEDSFYAIAEPAPADWLESAGQESDWLEATVAFHGAGEGALTCRVPANLVRDLASAYLGVPPEALGSNAKAMEDMTGELANMICGCWLTRAFPTRLFHLEGPAVRRHEEPPTGEWLVQLLNGLPLGLAVAVGA